VYRCRVLRLHRSTRAGARLSALHAACAQSSVCWEAGDGAGSCWITGRRSILCCMRRGYAGYMGAGGGCGIHRRRVRCWDWGCVRVREDGHHERGHVRGWHEREEQALRDRRARGGVGGWDVLHEGSVYDVVGGRRRRMRTSSPMEIPVSPLAYFGFFFLRRTSSIPPAVLTLPF
jgi:hypothetical protein